MQAAADVAIKSLPDTFVTDPDRVLRFERETRTLAALKHPHIATIYGFEEGRALVLEFAEGPPLADRIAPGTLSLDEALGMRQWSLIYDMFWSAYGGNVERLSCAPRIAGAESSRPSWRKSARSYVSAEAFQALADLAGLPPRDIIRRLPEPGLNKVAARVRG